MTCFCRRLTNNLSKGCISGGRSNHKEDCHGLVRCYHCGEPHPAPTKGCERFPFAREILIIRNKEKVLFAEMKRLALTTLSSPGQTFASTLKAQAQRKLQTSLPATVLHSTASVLSSNAEFQRQAHLKRNVHAARSLLMRHLQLSCKLLLTLLGRRKLPGRRLRPPLLRQQLRLTWSVAAGASWPAPTALNS